MTARKIQNNLPYGLGTKVGFDRKVALQLQQWRAQAENNDEQYHFNSVGGLLNSKQAARILQAMERLEGEQSRDAFKNKVAVSFENNPRLGFDGCEHFINKMLKANSIFAHLNLASTGLNADDIINIAHKISSAEFGAHISLNLSGSNQFDDACVQSILDMLAKPPDGVEIRLRLPKVRATLHRKNELERYGVTFAKKRAERVSAVSSGKLESAAASELTLEQARALLQQRLASTDESDHADAIEILRQLQGQLRESRAQQERVATEASAHDAIRQLQVRRSSLTAGADSDSEDDSSFDDDLSYEGVHNDAEVESAPNTFSISAQMEAFSEEVLRDLDSRSSCKAKVDYLLQRQAHYLSGEQTPAKQIKAVYLLMKLIQLFSLSNVDAVVDSNDQSNALFKRLDKMAEQKDRQTSSEDALPKLDDLNKELVISLTSFMGQIFEADNSISLGVSLAHSTDAETPLDDVEWDLELILELAKLLSLDRSLDGDKAILYGADGGEALYMHFCSLLYQALSNSAELDSAHQIDDSGVILTVFGELYFLLERDGVEEDAVEHDDGQAYQDLWWARDLLKSTRIAHLNFLIKHYADGEEQKEIYIAARDLFERSVLSDGDIQKLPSTLFIHPAVLTVLCEFGSWEHVFNVFEKALGNILQDVKFMGEHAIEVRKLQVLMLKVQGKVDEVVVFIKEHFAGDNKKHLLKAIHYHGSPQPECLFDKEILFGLNDVELAVDLLQKGKTLFAFLPGGPEDAEQKPAYLQDFVAELKAMFPGDSECISEAYNASARQKIHGLMMDTRRKVLGARSRLFTATSSADETVSAIGETKVTVTEQPGQ
jgi:hypothetical protein